MRPIHQVPKQSECAVQYEVFLTDEAPEIRYMKGVLTVVWFREPTLSTQTVRDLTFWKPLSASHTENLTEEFLARRKGVQEKFGIGKGTRRGSKSSNGISRK